MLFAGKTAGPDRLAAAEPGAGTQWKRTLFKTGVWPPSVLSRRNGFIEGMTDLPLLKLHFYFPSLQETQKLVKM